MKHELPKILVLLQHKDEAKAFMAKCSQEGYSPDRMLIVALSPDVQLYLKACNVAYQNTLPYFNNESHARVVERTEAMLVLLERNCPLSVALSNEFVFYIRVLISHLVWLAEILNTIYIQHPKITTLWAPSEWLPDKDDTWFLSLGERYLGALARAFARQRGISFEEIIVQKKQGPPHPASIELTPPGFFAKLYLNLSVGLLHLLLKRSTCGLLAANAYRLPYAAAKAEQERVNLAWLELLPNKVSFRFLLRRWVKWLLLVLRPQPTPPLFPLPLAAFVTQKAAITKVDQIQVALTSLADQVTTEWRDTFSHCGVDLTPYIVAKISHGCCNSMQKLIGIQPAVRAMLQALNIKLVLTPYGIGITNLIGDSCRELGIPAIMITHGTHVAPRNRAEEIELHRMSMGTILCPSYQYTVAQTPWARGHADYYGVGDKTLNSEPLLFSPLSQVDRRLLRNEMLNGDDDVAVIVYAVTYRRSEYTRFYVYETEDEILTDMVDLVRAVNKMDKVHLVLQLHPSFPYSTAELRSLLPGCSKLTLWHKVPFIKAISVADVLVSFSSTTIEEAIYNRVPVLLYDRWGRYCHLDAAYNCDQQKDCQPSAVYYTSDSIRLSSTLTSIIENRSQIREDEALYAQHSFGVSEYQPLAEHIKRILDFG